MPIDRTAFSFLLAILSLSKNSRSNNNNETFQVSSLGSSVVISDLVISLFLLHIFLQLKAHFVDDENMHLKQLIREAGFIADDDQVLEGKNDDLVFSLTPRSPRRVDLELLL